MDLIASLSSALGVDQAAATAVAGTVLGGVREQLADQGDPGVASQFESAVPELATWSEQAQKLAAGAAGDAPMGGLLSASGLGGQLLGAVAGEEAREAAAMVSVLSSLGIDQSKAALAAPLVLSFLRERLPEDLLSQALAAAPMLLGESEPSSASSMVSGALGSLFGSE